MMTGKDLTNQEKVDLMFEYLISSPARADRTGCVTFDDFVQDKLSPVNSSGIVKGDVVYFNKSLYFVREARINYFKCLPVIRTYEQICQKFDKVTKVEKSVYLPEIWDTEHHYEKLPINVKKIENVLVVECVEWFENGKARKVPGVYYVASLDGELEADNADWQPKQVLRTKEVPFFVKTL